VDYVQLGIPTQKE